jgi:aryl-alcohol dehydrogenase-like predicted oxidoreductase
MSSIRLAAPSCALGKTGVRVPLIGYGTAPLGKKNISREHAVECLNHAIDAGITYLDTSPAVAVSRTSAK